MERKCGDRMREFSKKMLVADGGYNISVYVSGDVVNLGIDIGVDGFWTPLNKSEVDEVILALKEAKKKAYLGYKP